MLSALHASRSYCPNTIDINTDEAEYRWLLQVLEDQVRASALHVLDTPTLWVASHIGIPLQVAAAGAGKPGDGQRLVVAEYRMLLNFVS
jgi:hypothetical protein